MDGKLAEWFAELINGFQHGEQKQARLVNDSGPLMFDGGPRYLAHGVNLGEHVPEQTGDEA